MIGVNFSASNCAKELYAGTSLKACPGPAFVHVIHLSPDWHHQETWHEFLFLCRWFSKRFRDKMAGGHAYSRSPAIFLYFLLFSTCCEFLDLNTYLSKQASLLYAVCDPASSEAAESPPSKVSYLVDSRHPCWRFRRRRFRFSVRLSHTPTSISSFQLSNLFISGDVQVNPGPIKCKLCCRTIASNHRTLKCGICSCNHHHIKCGEVKPKNCKKILEPPA